jgi:hypothetical protein
MKALEDWQIKDIIKQHAEGKTLVELAQIYNVHYKTIANYINAEKPAEGLNIKVFFNVQDNEKKQTFNHYGVIEQETKGRWLHLYKQNGEEAIINMDNVNQIISL